MKLVIVVNLSIQQLELQLLSMVSYPLTATVGGLARGVPRGGIGGRCPLPTAQVVEKIYGNWYHSLNVGNIFILLYYNSTPARVFTFPPGQVFQAICPLVKCPQLSAP